MTQSGHQRYRLVKQVYPHPSPSGNVIDTTIVRIQCTKAHTTIYDTVDQFENGAELTLKERTVVHEPIVLREIVNLHNSDGIKSRHQIRRMVKRIRSGKDILSPKGVPNIKLVKTRRSEWILFDGHHSLLSYMMAGRTYLHEVPHLVIANENEYVTEQEILVFFGMHAPQLKASNWRHYVINWQAPHERQLCSRKQHNMGELFDACASMPSIANSGDARTPLVS